MLFHLHLVAAWRHVNLPLLERDAFLLAVDLPHHTPQRNARARIFPHIDQIRKVLIDAIPVGMPLDEFGIVGDQIGHRPAIVTP